MTDNKNNNIWNKIEISSNNKKIKKFFKKSIKIKQVDKEKTLTQANNIIEDKSNNNSKTIFINKKRGRKLKTNDIITTGTHDRFSDDNLKRKVKTHFHNYIIALLNSKLKNSTQKEKLIKFGKIKSTITQNITVEFNQKLFNTKIKTIIAEVSDKYQNKGNNIQCINCIMNHPENYSEVIKYLNMTYKEMYLNYYLKSTKKDFYGAEVNESFETHKEKLQKFGDKYLDNYIKNAENLIDFYNKCKKRKARKQKENLSFNTSSLIEISINKKDNNNYSSKSNKGTFNNILNDYDELNFGENRICQGTQTDRKQTEDESEEEY